MARLEENLSMLLRTGVYGETAHVVVKVTEQIEKLREKLSVERRLKIPIFMNIFNYSLHLKFI